MTRSVFGILPDGESVEIITIEAAGIRAGICTFGARLHGLELSDGSGCGADVVCGLGTLSDMDDDRNYFGAVVGRVANRISGAAFSLDGRRFALSPNEGRHHLHGGERGLHRRNWRVAEVSDDAVVLETVSVHGDEGYPGALKIRAMYALAAERLELRLEAETDRPTVVNMTGHAYFNLAGHGNGPINGQELQLFSDQVLEVDSALLPTGLLVSAKGTTLDFTVPKRLGEGRAARIDNYFVVPGEGLRVAARLRDPESGRCMEVWTDQPGLQLYTADYVQAGTPGKGGVGYGARCGVCLEPHGFTDAPNRPEFPSVVLRPGELLTQTTQYRFEK